MSIVFIESYQYTEGGTAWFSTILFKKIYRNSVNQVGFLEKNFVRCVWQNTKLTVLYKPMHFQSMFYYNVIPVTKHYHNRNVDSSIN